MQANDMAQREYVASFRSRYSGTERRFAVLADCAHTASKLAQRVMPTTWQVVAVRPMVQA